MKISVSFAKLDDGSVLNALLPLSFSLMLMLLEVEQLFRFVVVTGH